MLKEMNPKVHPLELSSTYGRFAVEPLERGYGHTLGNAFRRVLLQHIEGAAVTEVRIEGVQHEFGTLPGVVEDIMEIILNIRELAIRVLPSDSQEDEEIILRLQAQGQKEVIAADIQTPPQVEIVNPELHLLEIASAEGSIDMEMWVRRGVGYWPTEARDRSQLPIGVIPIDAMFAPIVRANYRVEPTRVGSRTDVERLILELWGNGTVSPQEALVEAARHLRDYIAIFLGPEAAVAGAAVTLGAEEEGRDKILDTPIEEVEFSVRTLNCLKKENIHTLGDLIQRTEHDLLNIRNFGKRSLEEVLAKLAQFDLQLKSSKKD